MNLLTDLITPVHTERSAPAALDAFSPNWPSVKELNPGNSAPGPSPKRTKDSGLLAFMGSTGDCYDNSMIEALRSRMQVEIDRVLGMASPGGVVHFR